jgi:hypothetical protein
MNHVSLAAALVTTAIAVPAGWHTLDADIQSDGPQVRPKQQVLALDGTTSVTLDLDRGVMPSGGKASVTLVATSDHPHKVQIALSALQNQGYGAERVELPPLDVDHRVVTLDAQPGGGPPVVETFRLAKNDKKLGRYEWFDIRATPAKHAKGAEVEAASVGLTTWSGNSFAMTIEPPAVVPVEGEFSIAVRVKNTTKKPMRVPDIGVGGRIDGVDGLDSVLGLRSTDYDVQPIDDPSTGNYDDDKRLAPGAEALAVYHVTPHFGVDHFTFIAHATAYETGGALATLTVDRPKAEEPSDDTMTH